MEQENTNIFKDILYFSGKCLDIFDQRGMQETQDSMCPYS